MSNVTKSPIGKRILDAREALNLGQEKMAEIVGISRPSLSMIENGKREVSATELLRFAEALGRSLDYFLRPEDSGTLDFAPLLRIVNEDGTSQVREPAVTYGASTASQVQRALISFEELCRNYLDLEKINRLPVPPLPQFPFEPGRFMYREAERIADLMRTQLGLGVASPATQLRELLEERLSIKTFVLRSSTKLSGACIYHEGVGGCVLVVAKTIPHMLFTLGHEFAHLLVHRETPIVDRDLSGKDPREQFANAFAANLLMPRAGVQEFFASIYQTRRGFTDIDVIHMARYYGVSFDAMLSRLEGLRLIPPGSRKSLRASYRASNTGPKKRAQAAGIEQLAAPFWAPLPERYVFLAVRAYYRHQISIGKLAEILCDSQGRPRSIEQTQEFLDRYKAPDGEEPEAEESF